MEDDDPNRKNARRKSAQEDKADAIPGELLGLVFVCLTSPLDLVCAALACRRWRKVIAEEGFRVLCALHGAPSYIVASHYRVSWSGCHCRPPGRKPFFVPSSSSSWTGVAARDLALNFLPRTANNELIWELTDLRGSLLLLLDLNHTEHRRSLVKLSRLIVCDPLARRYVTIPLSTAFFHRTAVTLFLGAALLHGEDAGARISLSNFRLTCTLYQDRVGKTYMFSPSPGGHWTSSGATVRLDRDVPLKLIHFIGSNARFFHWMFGVYVLALDRESGELSCHTVLLDISGGRGRVVMDCVLELPWPSTFQACLS